MVGWHTGSSWSSSFCLDPCLRRLKRVSVVGHPIANSPQAVIRLYADFYKFLHLVSVWVILCWYVFRPFGTVNLASW